jgi:Kdo2-lipid IVA lauroyltransferase/acyltransferase
VKKPAIQYFLEHLAGYSSASRYRLAGLIAFLMVHLPNSILRQTRQNIKLCFPERSKSEQAQLIKQSILHSCLSLLELSKIWCSPVEKCLASVTKVTAPDSFNESSAGSIMIAPHLGSWELLNIWLADRFELISLYKPQDKSGTDYFMLQSRSRNGATLVPTSTSGLRQLMKGLQQGKCLMILPDQKPGKRSSKINSPFFGHSAPTTSLIYNLCHRTKSNVYISAAIRSETGDEFHIVVDTMDCEKLSASPESSAEYLNQSIESLVRSCPEQYQWGYPRFRKSVYRAIEPT